MNKKLLLIIIVLTFLLVPVGSSFAQTNHYSGKAFDCSIAGVWEGPLLGLATVVPLGPIGKRFAIVYDSPTHPEAFGYIMERYGVGVKFSSLGRGVITKMETNLYDFSMSRFVVLNDGNFPPTVMKMKTRGLTKFLDCDTRVYSCQTTIYDHQGLEVLCLPSQSYFFRTQPEEPCDDLPPFPVPE